ncbi:FAD-binding domain-containing protein [Apiospora saccharicola]|uniref:FAD-binding domain-containing protein n=1 Tax=Apiospora saccharicola TaxID=335842 RepID=A0ABR1VL34_9PEZI
MESDFRGLDEAFAYAATNAAEDVDAGLYLVYVHANGMNLGLPVFYHADVLHGAQLCAWAGFNSGSITAVGDTTKTRVLAEWAAETMHDSPNGKPPKPTSTWPHFARERFFDTVSEIADVPGIGPNIVYQAIGTPQLQQMKKDGGNAIGLDPSGGPIYIMLLAASWTH